MRIKFDITKEFNQFQERLIDESNGQIDEILNNNRKYFVNSMPYLEWDENTDQIIYNSFVLLHDRNIVQYDFQTNHFDWLERNTISSDNRNNNGNTVFRYLLCFVDKEFVRPVCRKWNQNIGMP